MAKTCKSNGLVNWVTERPVSGERVRNRQVTYLDLWDNVVFARTLPKGALILNNVVRLMRITKDLSGQERPISYQLVGEVMAHQGNDG